MATFKYDGNDLKNHKKYRIPSIFVLITSYKDSNHSNNMMKYTFT